MVATDINEALFQIQLTYAYMTVACARGDYEWAAVESARLLSQIQEAAARRMNVKTN